MATFNKTGTSTPEGTSDVMRITGDMTARINFTNSNVQIQGLDLNGDGRIATNGQENKSSYLVTVDKNYAASNFEILDAYARNPLDTTDKASNFLGDIYYNGMGVDGDGVSTNGNIFLGGLGADSALGGIGNDFMVGGGVAADRFQWLPNAAGTDVLTDTLTGKAVPGGANASAKSDYLSGGRNADFFFADLSVIDPTDGNGTTFNGGSTTDDSAAGLADSLSGANSQNNDWVLLEANDDDEPTVVTLGNGTIKTDAGQKATLINMESLDASGNLYGFINNFDVKIGERATDARTANAAFVAGAENYSFGSTAQLNVIGSDAANIVIGGFDNDKVDGAAGGDLLFGGNLSYLLANKNNPNLLNKAGGLSLNMTKAGTVNDGMDSLMGGSGDDNIVFEMDKGSVSGDTSSNTTSADTLKDTGDALWLTDFSMGRVKGATMAGEANKQAAENAALAKLTTDSTVRIDLGNDGKANYRYYGGSNADSQDQTNYASTLGTKAFVKMSGMDSVIATGLGAVDFTAAGTNNPELVFNNQQNFKGIDANLSLRGSVADNTLYANTGNDVVEGRQGDDNLSGGRGDDTFIFAAGDGVDTVHRQQDTNNDNLWDNYDATTGQGSFVQDFRSDAGIGPQQASRLVIDFHNTDLASLDVAVTAFSIRIGGVDFATEAVNLKNAKSVAGLANIVNNAFHHQDASVSAIAVGNTVQIIDTKARVMSDTIQDGFLVSIALANGAAETTATFTDANAPTSVVDNDIIVFKDYANRATNTGTDLKTAPALDGTNNNVKLQAGDLTTAFLSNDAGKIDTHLAYSQKVLVKIADANAGDVVTVTVNGVPFSYTAKAGDTSATIAQGLVDVINNYPDVNTAAGALVASTTDSLGQPLNGDTGNDGTGQHNFMNAADGSTAELSIMQKGGFSGSKVYMNVDVTQPKGTGAILTTHDQSENNINLYSYDGRNGGLDEAFIRFTGKYDSQSATQAYSDVFSSTVKTAKDTGGQLAGTNANANGLNGDDLLIGGPGNDSIMGGSGDDRIIMSAGTDTVSGGGDVLTAAGQTVRYTDVLQAEDATFNNKAQFTVTLLPTKGAGTVVAKDATSGSVLGTTTFDTMEAVRVLENDRDTRLDLTQLGGNIRVDLGTATGVWFNWNGTSGTQTTSTYGADNLSTLTGDDTVNIDGSQLFANNQIDLGGQTVADTVNYTDGQNNYVDGTGLPQTGTPVAPNALGSLQVTTTLTVGASGQPDTVSMTGGVLGSQTTSDTLTNVENINFDALANEGYKDTLDVSGVVGATINFTGSATGAVNIGTTATPQPTLAAGGIAASTDQATELLTVGGGSVVATGAVPGIASFENVIGSTGDDRVIVGNHAFLQAGPVVDNKGTVDPSDDVTLFSGYNWNLGDSAKDTLDYRAETHNLSVRVDTSANSAVTPAVTTSVDTVTVGTGLGTATQVTDRVDTANGVERYIGGTNNGVTPVPAATQNTIDLSGATVATTVNFTVMDANATLLAQNGTPNVVADPNGSTTQFTHTDVYSTAAPTNVFASFLDAGTTVSAKTWNVVKGSANDETVLMNPVDTSAHTLDLGASTATGTNTVDYSKFYTGVNLTVNASQNSVPMAGTTPAPAVDKSTYAVGADKISISRADTVAGVAKGDLTVVGTSAVDGISFANGTATPNTLKNYIDHVVVDLSGSVGTIDEYNNVNDSNAGATIVTTAATATLASGLTAYAATPLESFRTTVVNFDNVTGTDAYTEATGKVVASGNDLLSGSTGANLINGLSGNDLILGNGGADTLYGGVGDDTIKGGSSVETIDGGAGDDQITGAGGNDSLTGGAGNDQFIYNSYTDSYDPNTFINPSLSDPFDNLNGTFAGMVNPFTGLTGMPASGGTAGVPAATVPYVVGTLDLSFDAESLNDFTPGTPAIPATATTPAVPAVPGDSIVLEVQDSSDMLKGLTVSATTPVTVAGNLIPVGNAIPFITIAPDNSTVTNTTVINTTTIPAVGTPTTTTSTVAASVATSDADTYPAEVSVIMGLGSDHAIGTVVNVTNDQRVGAATPLLSAADASTVDQVLTLEPNATPLASDFLLRVQQSAGSGATEDFNVVAQTLTAAVAPALPVATYNQVTAQVVYSAANQSQSGTVDNLRNFNLDTDKLDFTGLGLAQYAKDYDAVKDGIQVDEILKVVVGTLDATTLLNNNFAPDQVQNPAAYAAHQTNAANGNVLFVLEAEATASATGGLVTPTGAYRLFVDANHDGVYNPATDMVIDFSSEANANTTLPVTPANMLNTVLGLIGTQVTTDLLTAATAGHPVAIDSTILI